MKVFNKLKNLSLMGVIIISGVACSQKAFRAPGSAELTDSGYKGPSKGSQEGGGLSSGSEVNTMESGQTGNISSIGSEGTTNPQIDPPPVSNIPPIGGTPTPVPVSNSNSNTSVSVGHLCSNRLTNLAQGNAKTLNKDFIVRVYDSTGSVLLCERSGLDIRSAILNEKKLLLPGSCQNLNIQKVRVSVVAKSGGGGTEGVSSNLLFAQEFSKVVASIEVPYADLFPTQGGVTRMAQVRLGLGGVGGNYTAWGIPGSGKKYKLYILVGDGQHTSCDARD